MDFHLLHRAAEGRGAPGVELQAVGPQGPGELGL